MAYRISSDCGGCDHCRPLCPTEAIQMTDEGNFWIDPVLCNNCEGHAPEPLCAQVCEINAPVPFEAKKGRNRLVDDRPVPSVDLFPNLRNHPFASSIVVWEACNLLAQRQTLPWIETGNHQLSYKHPIQYGQGQITFKLTQSVTQEPPIGLAGIEAIKLLETLDIRSAGLHLIFAAYATTLNRPWEEDFIINDQQLESYLGLDKRRDLSKPARLNLIKNLVLQPCQLIINLDFPRRGRIKAFSLSDSRVWHLVDMQHHFQTDELGCYHWVGVTFRIRAGAWSQHFLNKQACHDQTAFYQYSSLPRSLLTSIMSLWQQHEGAVRMMLWLLFKVRMGSEQRVTVPTLMRIAYGEVRVHKASAHREERKRLLRTYEGDLAALQDYGLKPIFDPVTYPLPIQPLWSKLANLPEDAEEALEFWTADGSREHRLTDVGPRGKWKQLMSARILNFELPEDWQALPEKLQKKRQRFQRNSAAVAATTTTPGQASSLSGEQIMSARKKLGWSQRELADRTGKSQSWIRDIEQGRFHVKGHDQMLLKQLLNLPPLDSDQS